MTHDMNAETSVENQCHYDAITSMDAVHFQILCHSRNITSMQQQFLEEKNLNITPQSYHNHNKLTYQY